MHWDKVYYKNGVRYVTLRDVPNKEIDDVGISQYMGLRTTYEPRTILKNVAKVVTNTQPVLSNKFPEMLIKQKPQGEFAVLLSGGVDSSVLARLYDGPDTHFVFVQTLLGNERPFFDMIAKTLKGHIHIVNLKNDDLYYQYSKNIYSTIREPVGDAAIVAVYAAAKFVHETLKLDRMVIGEGGDEVFGGYWQYENFQVFTESRHFPPIDYIKNTFGVGFNRPPEELLNHWEFVPIEIGCGATNDYVLRAMGWDYSKGLQNLFYWKNIEACELNKVIPVLPYFHSNVYWYVRNNVPRDKIVNCNNKLKLKIFLKEFALDVGVPVECVDRVKMGFRCEANENVMVRMMQDIGESIQPSSAQVFAAWSLKIWCESVGVPMNMRRMLP